MLDDRCLVDETPLNTLCVLSRLYTLFQINTADEHLFLSLDPDGGTDLASNVAYLAKC